MRQIWIPRIGAPDVLEVREAPDPEAGPGEVRVRVEATGVNFADIMARMGLYPDAPKLPTVVGYEVSGVIDQVGAGVDHLQEGQRVISLTRFGGYTDTAVVPAIQVAPLPDGVSFEEAAAIPVQYLTAWLMLVKLGNVAEGDTVLVHGAAGGVGQAATQICLWRGARVIGTASPHKHDRLRDAGVTDCIDYRSEDFEERTMAMTDGQGVDIALDPIGGKSFTKSYRCLAPMGRLFMFGASSMAPGKKRKLIPAVKGFLAMPTFKPLPLMDANRGVFGVNLGHLWDRAGELRAMLEDIVALVDEGAFAPVVDKAFPFDAPADAHRYIQDRKNFGKVILVTDPERVR